MADLLRTMVFDTRFPIGAEVVIMIGCPCWAANEELLIDWSIGEDVTVFVDRIDIDAAAAAWAGERIGVFGDKSSCFISCLISCLITVVFWLDAKMAGVCCFLTTATGVLTGIGCGGGIDSIFCTSKMYACAVGVGVQHTSSVVVDARTSDTRDATGGTSTSKYHRSLQQTCEFRAFQENHKPFRNIKAADKYISLILIDHSFTKTIIERNIYNKISIVGTNWCE